MLHRPGTNLTLSAPKPVSVAALIGGDRRILAARDRAVERRMAWVEKDVVQTRLTNPNTGRKVRSGGQRTVAATCARAQAGKREVCIREERPARSAEDDQRSMVDREGSLPRTSHTQYFVPQRKLPSCLIDDITMPKFALKSYRQAANSTSKSSVTGTNLSSAIAHAAWPPNIAET